jgi:histidine triad (HIT) family protein
MSSIFTKIVNGEIPCYKIAETEKYLAFLDVFPLKKGHALVIPKQEVNYIFDLENELYLGLFAFAKQVSIALKKAVPCERIALSIVGLEVPHAHIHLIPISNISDMNFSNSKLSFSKEEFIAIANSIAQEFV